METRQNDYRIRFTWNGKRYIEVIKLRPSVSHLKNVEQTAKRVTEAIENGTFEYGRFFPNSKHAGPRATVSETFGERCVTWLNSRKSSTTKGTRDHDRNYIEFWKRLLGADTLMTDLIPSRIEVAVGKHPWPSAKHRNNMLSSLRGVFAQWVRDDEFNRRDPTAALKNMKVQRPLKNPLSLEEVEMILDDMRKHYDERVEAYFEFEFFAGTRPEETIPFRWPKFIEEKRTANIDVVRTAREEMDTTKTGEARVVKLNVRALHAIEVMRPYTQGKAHGHVFENPRTGKPWASEADQRDEYWTPTLKRLGLPHRRAYVTRSTRASMMLSAGLAPAYCAKQLGHSEAVFFKDYADYIDDAASEREFKKDNAALSRKRPSRRK